MTCPHTTDDLPWYVNGTMPAVARTAFARHLEDCPECQAALAFDDRLRAALRSTAPKVLPTPHAAWKSLERRLGDLETAVASRDSERRSDAGATAADVSPARVSVASRARRRGSSRRRRPWLLGFAVAAQAVAILALTTLVWESLRVPTPATYRTLSTPDPAMMRSGRHVRVTLAPEVQPSSVQRMAEAERVRIVSGPAGPNVYTFEVLVAEGEDQDARVEQVLARLRERAEVLLAEPTALEPLSR